MGFKTDQLRIDQIEHTGVQHNVSNLHAGQNNFLEQIGHIEDPTDEMPGEGSHASVDEKEVMTEMCDQEAGENPQ